MEKGIFLIIVLLFTSCNINSENEEVTHSVYVDNCKYVIIRTVKGAGIVHAGDCENH